MWILLVLCNGCSMTDLLDADGDGYARVAFTDAGEEDCDDADPRVHPDAIEAEGDAATDNDCDGDGAEVDADDDGVNADEDCDDGDDTVSPAAEEACGDGVDQNCDPTDCVAIEEDFALDLAASEALRGEEAGDHLGQALALARIGGTPTLVIGAPGAEGGAGAIYLVSLTSQEDDTALELAASPSLTGGAGDALGTTLLAADLDQDGCDELVLGAPGVADGDGGVTVVPCNEAWSTSPEGHALSAPADAGGRLGEALGALTGEDQAWLILGERDASRVWFLPSSAEGPVESQGWAMAGTAGDALGGAVVAIPGDVPRVAVGAAWAAPSPDTPAGGAVAVLDPEADEIATLSDAPWLLFGAEGDALGAALASGDLDGDGAEDLVIGAPDAGRVRVVSGAQFGRTWSGGWADLEGADTWTFYLDGGDAAEAGLGASLSVTPDLTGDEIADLLIAAPGAQITTDNDGPEGAVWLACSEDLRVERRLDLDAALVAVGPFGAGAALQASADPAPPVLAIGAPLLANGQGAVFLIPGPGQ